MKCYYFSYTLATLVVSSKVYTNCHNVIILIQALPLKRPGTPADRLEQAKTRKPAGVPISARRFVEEHGHLDAPLLGDKACMWDALRACGSRLGRQVM